MVRFTLALIKTMLRASYYAPGHPEAKKGLTDLHSEFVLLLGDRAELTYMVTVTADDRAITIDGYDDAPLPLERVMKQDATSLFVPKFLEFFDRWNLLSFSLKATISPEEFHTFLVLMSQPPEASQGTTDAAKRLTQAFLDQHIIHVSTVFNDDIVGKERRLPWRLKMALSRLRRDLRMLPLYKGASPEEIQRIKTQIIDDVVRPIRQAGFVKDFLVNCDLVAADVDLMDERQVQEAILTSLPEERLVQTTWDLVKDLEQSQMTPGQTPAEGTSVEATRRMDVLRQIADHVCRKGSTPGHELLESLFKHQALSLEDLPPEVRQNVETRRLADSVLAREDEHVTALRRLTADGDGRELVETVQRVVPELLRRGAYGTVAKILRATNEQRQVPGAPTVFSELAGQLSQLAASKDTIEQLLADLHSSDKDRRTQVVEILAAAGEPAAAGLIKAYANGDNQSVRLSVFDAMKRIGPIALDPFLSRLATIERNAQLICHILTAVGDHGEVALARSLNRFLHHSSAPVREAVLRALVKLQGPAAESSLLRALRDQETAVRQSALGHLARITSSHSEALEAFGRALRADDPTAPRENDTTLLQVCQALARFASLPTEHHSRAEAILLQALESVRPKGVLSWVNKPSPRHSEGVRAAICDALAAVGGPAATGPMRQIEKTDAAPVAAKAGAAADQIERRRGERR